MTTWLITGGAGFIGSHFVHRASTIPGVRLVILDALTYAANLANISKPLNLPHVTFIKGNICDAPLLLELFEKYEVTHILNFAAESHVDRSISGAQPFMKTNIEGTFTLLETARKYWTNHYQKRFLHISTDEVYGSLKPYDPPFNENSPYRPNSPYSASKASSDMLVKAWHHTYGLPTLIGNCSNNYGPWQFPEKLIPLTILNALEERELPVYGDGLQIRDWLYVEDHCEALLNILQDGRVGETYTIGGNSERNNLEVVQKICDAVDTFTGKSSGTSRKLIQHIKDRPGHDRRYAIDSSKLKKELGWKPRRSFEDTLKEVVQWYLGHQDWSHEVRSGDYLHYYALQYRKKR